MSDYWRIPEAAVIIALTYVLLVIVGREFKRRRGVPFGPGYHIAALAVGTILANSMTGIFGEENLGEVCESLGMRPDEITLRTAARWVYRGSLIVATYAGVGVLLALVRRFYWELWFESRHREHAPKFLRQIFSVAVYLAATLILVETVLDTRIPGLLTGSGILVAVVGLAMQDLLGNIIAGAALNIGKPYRIGDWLLFEGRNAEVVEVNWRSTRLVTNDRHRLEYPNNVIARMPLVNLGARGVVRAMRVTVHVDYSAPPNAVKAAFLRAARHTEGILEHPPTVVQLRDFGDNAAVYDIKLHIDDPSRYQEISDALRTHVWYEMRREGISIAAPKRVLSREKGHAATLAERREETARLLLGQPLFSHLHGHDADRLVAGARPVLYAAGEEVVKAGEPGESLFLIVTGRVRVDIVKEGVHRTVAHLGDGECFGEMSLLTGEPRGADVFADTDCELLEITKDVFAVVLRERPEILPLLSDLLARRRAANDAALANLSGEHHEAALRRHGDELLARITAFFSL